MATYGKKKRSLLPSLSILRDSDASSKARHKAPKTRDYLLLTVSQSNYNSQGGENNLDDSIGEMASMLLDDTTEEQVKPDPGRHLSQMVTASTLPNLANAKVDNDKSLPQLQKLIFTGDDAWALKTAPVVTAAGTSNSMYFVSNSEEVSNLYTLPSSGTHSRKGSAPTIPRKSSKRKSACSKSSHTKVQFGGDRKQALKNSISPPKRLEPLQPQKSEATEVNKKIEAMLAATTALKGSTQPQKLEATDANNKIHSMLTTRKALKGDPDQALLQGPYLPTRKSRLMDSKVLAKMKTAINDRLQARSARRRDSARLLDPPNWEEPLSDLEIRLNEGENWKNPKVFNLTGSGVIHRKPVADDGKSLKSIRSSIKSRQSFEDPILGTHQSSVLTRIPTSLENKLGDDMSLDQSGEFIPDLPTPNKDLSQFQKPKLKRHRYGGDIDAILSSSPEAQSTPRLRLEPSFEDNGRKTFRNVPAHSRSVFNFGLDNSYVGQSSHMGIDSSPAAKPVSAEDSLKRKNPQSITAAELKRSKKHPSPSKEELDRLALAVKNIPLEPPVANAAARGTLSTKGTNEKLKEAKRTAQGKVAFAKQELMKTTGSMPNLGAKGLKSAMRKPTPEKGDNRQYFSQTNLADRSMMDLDELQWDKTEYNIGMRMD